MFTKNVIIFFFKNEMTMLGQTLGITLKIIKPSASKTQEFISYHPESKLNIEPVVVLLSEDGRNYNILLE